MSSTNAPTPFDPPDLPIAFSALNSAIEQVGALWHLTVRGYQLAAYGFGKGLV